MVAVIALFPTPIALSRSSSLFESMLELLRAVLTLLYPRVVGDGVESSGVGDPYRGGVLGHDIGNEHLFGVASSDRMTVGRRFDRSA
jgi:hypothetical protein